MTSIAVLKVKVSQNEFNIIAKTIESLSCVTIKLSVSCALIQQG